MPRAVVCRRCCADDDQTRPGTNTVEPGSQLVSRARRNSRCTTQRRAAHGFIWNTTHLTPGTANTCLELQLEALLPLLYVRAGSEKKRLPSATPPVLQRHSRQIAVRDSALPPRVDRATAKVISRPASATMLDTPAFVHVISRAAAPVLFYRRASQPVRRVANERSRAAAVPLGFHEDLQMRGLSHHAPRGLPQRLGTSAGKKGLRSYRKQPEVSTPRVDASRPNMCCGGTVETRLRFTPPSTSSAVSRAFSKRLRQVFGCAAGSPVDPEVNAIATTRAAGTTRSRVATFCIPATGGPHVRYPHRRACDGFGYSRRSRARESSF